jgi:hypothetical protein
MLYAFFDVYTKRERNTQSGTPRNSIFVVIIIAAILFISDNQYTDLAIVIH